MKEPVDAPASVPRRWRRSTS